MFFGCYKILSVSKNKDKVKADFQNSQKANDSYSVTVRTMHIIVDIPD
jgi:hypothetical protein